MAAATRCDADYAIYVGAKQQYGFFYAIGQHAKCCLALDLVEETTRREGGTTQRTGNKTFWDNTIFDVSLCRIAFEHFSTRFRTDNSLLADLVALLGVGKLFFTS